MNTPLDHLLPHVRRLRCADVDEAPESPGIYAWYSTLAVGPKDWELDVTDGKDLGINRLREVLARHSARFSTPPLDVIAVGRFTAAWRGKIPSEGSLQMHNELSTTTSQDDKTSTLPALSRVLTAPTLRKALVDTLGLATPLLTSPIYIGVSDDLRRRLREHVQGLQKCTTVVSRDPNARQRLLESDKTFAFRAIGSGLSIENLEVWTLDLSSAMGNKFSANELRTLAEAAEWLLNRWHRPLHGKR